MTNFLGCLTGGIGRGRPNIEGYFGLKAFFANGTVLGSSSTMAARAATSASGMADGILL